MFECKAYANLANGTVTDNRVKFALKECNDETAVFVSALTGGYDGCFENMWIDPDKGVCIELLPKKRVKRFMAVFRSSEFWCEPFFGTDIAAMPNETQFAVLEMEDGTFCTIVPVVNDKYKCVLEGGKNGKITARIFSWADSLYSCDGLAFVFSLGDNPNIMTKNCVNLALKLMESPTRPIEKRRYPEIFEYLGWCSWDSMNISVNEKGLLEKCEEFKRKNIPVKWIILDDMWAEIKDFRKHGYSDFMDMINLMYSSALYDFEADPIRFPDGLAECIRKIKGYGMSVGIWHPTTGYWRGIDPNGRAAQVLKEYLMTLKNGYLIPDWHTEKAYMYYKTMHDFFEKCGADFVKIDNQSMTKRYYKGDAPVGVIAKNFHDAMEASVGEHFDNRMINCMGMASEDMWSRKVSPISRSSSDFKPENKEWFAKHVLQCAYNSVIQGQFYWCDWDMWWSDDGQSKKNGLVHAVSGGPIYVSDKIDRSNAEIFEPLVLSNGKILRCDRACMPAYDCVTVDCRKSNKSLKLQNIAGGCGIMAVLNINENNVETESTISDMYIDGFDADEYAVYEHFSKSVKIMKKGESFVDRLKNNDEYRLYVFVPLKDGFGVIGRTDKYISPKTVKFVCDKKIILEENGPYAYIDNRELHISE